MLVLNLLVFEELQCEFERAFLHLRMQLLTRCPRQQCEQALHERLLLRVLRRHALRFFFEDIKRLLKQWVESINELLENWARNALVEGGHLV